MNKSEEATLVSRRPLRSKLSIAMSKTDAHRGTGFNREVILDTLTPIIARELRQMADQEAEAEGDGYYGAGAHALAERFIAALTVPTRPYKGRRAKHERESVRPSDAE